MDLSGSLMLARRCEEGAVLTRVWSLDSLEKRRTAIRSYVGKATHNLIGAQTPSLSTRIMGAAYVVTENVARPMKGAGEEPNGFSTIVSIVRSVSVLEVEVAIMQ